MTFGLQKKFEWHTLALIVGAAAFGTSVFACAADTTNGDQSKLSGDEDDENEDDKAEADDDTEADDDDEPPPSKPAKDAGLAPAKDSGGSAARPDAGDNKGSEGQPPAPTGDNSLWCKAKPVLTKYCVDCHTDGGNGPMPLEVPDDFKGNAPNSKDKSVVDVTKTRINATTKPMPPQAKLKPEELRALNEWLAAGSPGSASADCGVAEPSTSQVWPPAGCEKMYQITAAKNGGKTKIAPGTETQPQLVSDAPWGNSKLQALGFKPITDNKRVLHHWIVYDNATRAFITGWAPGQDDSEFDKLPEDVGIYLPSGTQSVRLQMHYYNLFSDAKPEEDGSGVEVCTTTKLRKYESTTFMQFMAIPVLQPGKQDVVGNCNVSVTQPVYLLSESPHAHKLAYHMKFEILRGGQLFKKLRDDPFSFEEQTSRSLPEPLEIKNGDVVRTTCQFNNDTGKVVTFGENTGNEMCFNFATYYPKGALSCSGGGLGGVLGGGR